MLDKQYKRVEVSTDQLRAHKTHQIPKPGAQLKQHSQRSHQNNQTLTLIYTLSELFSQVMTACKGRQIEGRLRSCAMQPSAAYDGPMCTSKYQQPAVLKWQGNVPVGHAGRNPSSTPHHPLQQQQAFTSNSRLLFTSFSTGIQPKAATGIHQQHQRLAARNSRLAFSNNIRLAWPAKLCCGGHKKPDVESTLHVMLCRQVLTGQP